PRAPGPAAGRSSRYASISDWRNLDRLPRAPGDGWQARRTRGRTIVGKAAVDKAAARWNPLDPLLIGAPGFTRFLPVLHVAEYRDAAHSRVLGRQRLALFVVVAAAVLLLLSGLMAERV